MDRRNFLKNSLTLGSGSFLLSHLPFKTFATPDMLPLMNCPDLNNRVLVVIFLKGGNDGVNTLIPTNQYDTYMSHRPGIGLSMTGSNAMISLDSTLPLDDQIHLHPTMTAFKSMYDEAKARIIHNVGYPNINGSHFKSTDLWLSGGDGTPAYNNIKNGWMGRFLDTTFPGLYGDPIEGFLDPIGIQLGDRKPSLSFHDHDGNYVAANLSQQEPGGLYDQIQGIGTPGHNVLGNTEYEQHISYIMNVENSTNIYAQRITDVFNTGTNSSTVYPATDLANQLKTIAKLLSGGSKTKIFMVHLNGFDTHAQQVEAGSVHLGDHASLLTDLFNSTKAFHEDLTNLGLEQRVISASFSEFGRQVIENGSLGTDHGTLGPMFLFGSSVEAGISGVNMDLNDISSGGKPNETQMQFDYRQVFRTLIQNWLGASDSVSQNTFLDTYPIIPSLLASNVIVDPTCYVNSYIDQIQIRARVFLEGFYDKDSGNSMRRTLNEKGLIPLTQPYNTPPFNYTGTESVSTLKWNAVDWILLELRDSNNLNTIVSRQAAFLNSDGFIMDLNGENGITFRGVPSGSYHLVVYHRNHIAIVSSNPIHSSDTQEYDFTIEMSSAYGTNQLKDMGDGTLAMFAGDFDGNNINNASDYASWNSNNAEIEQYISIDGDGNGVVNNQDFNLWKNNENQTGDPIIQL